MACCITSQKFLFLLLLFLAESVLLHATQSNSSLARCIDTERAALLKFKETLTDPLGWLSSWVGENCCNWMGVACSNHTGHVVKLDLQNPFFCYMYNSTDEAATHNISCLGGTLNPSLLNLTYLNYLDLSQNNFQGAVIPEFLGSLKNLKYLDLSSATFSGLIPPHIGNLSNLIHLDLTTYSYPTYLWVSDINWLSSLSSLQYLGLGGVNLSMVSANYLQAINMLPSILELHLSGSQLQDLPQSLPIVNFTSLSVLDLSGNNFSSPLPPWVFNISTLSTLKLESCSLTGNIPEISWGSSCSLQTLDLSFNDLSDSIKQFIDALAIGCNNNSLQTLDLGSNNLDGDLPESLGLLSNMGDLWLGLNSFSGPLPRGIANLSSLRILDVSFNKLTGSIPETIGQLASLSSLGLYGNSWEGIVTETHLQNLTLVEFSLSSTTSALTFNVRPDWTPPFNLFDLAIDDCKIGPSFPSWLKTQNQTFQLSLSNVFISDTIPDWLWTFSPTLWYLDLSLNQLRGRLPSLIAVGNSEGGWIDLGFNSLEGSVPFCPNVTFLSLSHNMLSGPIPSNIGQVMSNLENLDLSKNLLNGSIPLSIRRMANLTFLDLSSNYLSGKIPSNLDGMQILRVLDLSNNSLFGNVPESICLLPIYWLSLSRNNLFGDLSSSMQNCTGLLYLDLGYNKFTGTLASWIGDNFLPLSYIGLRSNKLTGKVPQQLCRFLFLHILDLANNNLSGSIPKCLGDLRASKTQMVSYYQTLPSVQHIEFNTHLELTVKGSTHEYTKIIDLVNMLDLSHNNLSGQIPEEITNLTAFGTLSLSWNQLSGGIPESIGNMRWLESLDLSWNHLSGPIPVSMPSMTSLSYLNLSYNNLSGPIPTANQFLGFNASSFEGNPELCGPQLSNKCTSGNNEGTVNTGDKVESEDEGDIFWFHVIRGLGFMLGFWAVCGTLMMNKSWRHAYFRFIDKMNDRFLLAFSLIVARLRRKVEWS